MGFGQHDDRSKVLLVWKEYGEEVVGVYSNWKKAQAALELACDYLRHHPTAKHSHDTITHFCGITRYEVQ